MLKSFALRGRELPLTIYGPPGLADLVSALRRVFGRLSYEVELVEVRPGDRFERDEYRLETFAVSHGVHGVGWMLLEEPRPGRFDVEAADALGVEPRQRGDLQRGGSVTTLDGRVVTPDLVLGPARAGRKLVLTGDTAPAQSVIEAAAGADLLVHEATFGDEEQERAQETLHSTATQAAVVARAAGVGMLALTHLSPRYFGPELAREAQSVFAETVVPKDFDVIEVPFPERGPAQLIKGGALQRRDEPVSSAAQ
jgi:ribonuclease Z